MDERVKEIEAQIEQLKAAIDNVRAATQTHLDLDLGNMRKEADVALEAANELQAKLDAAGDLPTPIDTQALAETIRQADLVNEAVARLQQRKKHEEVAIRYEAEATEITARMEAREKAKQDAIAAAKLPVAGITFGDGEVLLDGVPFDQASTAQKFRVRVAIAVAKNPTLRLVWVRDASLLDDNSYELIAKLAAEFDCQILLETVRAIGKDAIVLEDGRLKRDEAPAEAVAIMTLAIFYDTETSGLPLFKEPSEDPRQPHIVQLAACLVDLDTGQTVSSMDVIVRPNGWTIPDNVAAIHGITTERAMNRWAWRKRRRSTCSWNFAAVAFASRTTKVLMRGYCALRSCDIKIRISLTAGKKVRPSVRKPSQRRSSNCHPPRR